MSRPPPSPRMKTRLTRLGVALEVGSLSVDSRRLFTWREQHRPFGLGSASFPFSSAFSFSFSFSSFSGSFLSPLLVRFSPSPPRRPCLFGRAHEFRIFVLDGGQVVGISRRA